METFVRKVVESGEFMAEVIHLCKNLIWDEEDIIQKGVGWELKDNLRSAPNSILPYLTLVTYLYFFSAIGGKNDA